MKKIFSCPDVSVIVANHNGKKHLEKCFSSLRNLDYEKEKLQIIMVDNCSTDGSDGFVKKRFPYVRILHNDVNNYAKANNIGIKSSDGEYAALLNNDTYVDKNWLNELIKVIRKNNRIGCTGSKVLLPDGRIQSTGHYEFPNFYWGDRGLREPNLGQYDFSEEVSSLSGSSVLFRRKCLEDVGFLDEDFVMYLEDVDLFLRCRDKEWKLMYAPKSIVYHEFHGTASDKLVNYYIERNRLLLIAKHFPEKLSDALIGKGYFIHNKDAATQNEIYSILPEVFTKLLNVHGRKTMHILMPGIFENLKKLENLRKDTVMQFLNNEQENLKKIIQEKDVQKISIEASYKQETTSLSSQNKDLLDKLTQLEKTARDISDQKAQIEASYKQETTSLSSQNKDLLDKLTQKEDLFNNLVREIVEKDILIKDLFIQKSSIEQELRIKIEDFYHKKDEFEAEIKSLKIEIIKNEAIIEEKNKELNNRQTLVQNLSYQLGDITRETELLKNESSEKDILIKDIKLKFKDLENKLNESNNIIEDKNIEITAQKNSILKLENDKAQIEASYKQETTSLSSQNKDLLDKLSQLEKTARDMSDQIKSLDLKLQKLEQELDISYAAIKGKDCEIENYKNNVNRLETRIKDIYNSQTYRFIVKPIWDFLDMVKPRSRGFRSIISHIFRSLLLLIIVFLFSVFIVMPLKIRKFFKF